MVSAFPIQQHYEKKKRKERKKWKMGFTCCHPLLCTSPTLVVEHLPAKSIEQIIEVALKGNKDVCYLSLFKA
jgi:hypothetical protein